MLNSQEKYKIASFFSNLELLMIDFKEKSESIRSVIPHMSRREIDEIFEEVKLRGGLDEEVEKIRQNILTVLERIFATGKSYWENLELQEARVKIANLEKVPDELFKAHTNFLKNQCPQHFAELEERLGVENITMDNFVRFLANKEWKERYGKFEMELRKNRQINQKNKLNDKYQKQVRNIKKLVKKTNIKLLNLGNQLQSKDIENNKLFNEKENLSKNLTNLKSQINQRKQNKHYLEEELDLKKHKIKKLKNSAKKQGVELTISQEKITKLEKTITKWTQEKESWEKREQQLLAQIELLKNPPRQVNKESLQIETSKYVDQVKILNEKLLPEQIKVINLIYQEQKEKMNKQVNQLENQLMSNSKEARERERERERGLVLNSGYGVFSISGWVYVAS